MDELRHECGIAAIYHFDSPITSPLVPPRQGQMGTSRLMPRMLIDLQNRGQLAAGMTTFSPLRNSRLKTYKKIGTVIEAFRLSHAAKFESIMHQHDGRAAIGHVRYATCGKNEVDHAQPFEHQHGRAWKWFAMAFNGQLANFRDLKNELLAKTDYSLQRDLDTEVIMHHLSYELRGDDRPDLLHVFRKLSKKFDGAYNISFLNARGDLAVARDPKGFRPLCYAVEGPLFAAASESIALANLGFRDVKSLQPGEMALIQDGEFQLARFADEQTTSHCFFEWIYFANVASNLDGQSVYLARSELGKQLADQEFKLGVVKPDNDTVVVPVPDTAKAAADAMAFHLGIPSVEGLMRNRHIGRTFIEGNNRADRVRMKFSPLPEVLRDKKVILVEDSIVRATTLATLLKLIRERGGAKEIHVRVACPPIIAPCFYGIDMSTIEELYAPKFIRGRELTLDDQKAMARDLGADSLLYLPVSAISAAVGKPANSLCQACLTGEYPTETGTQLLQLAVRNHHGKDHGRTYETERTNGVHLVRGAPPAC